MKISVRYKLFIFSFVILGINVVLGYAVYTSDQKLLESEQWLQHSEQVIIQSSNVRALGREMQITSRDFLITDDSVFLEPLNHAQNAAFVYIGALRQLTRDNPAQQKLIDSLDLYMHKLVNYSSKAIELRGKQGLSAVIAYTADKQRKRYTNRINQIANTIQWQEDILFKSRKQINARNETAFGRFSLAIFMSMAGFTILLVIIAGKYLYQATEKRKRAAELVVANKELLFQNQEKGDRAAELVIANEELLFQNEEKGKRAYELLIANDELYFQHAEKEKRAAELLIANKELLFQNEEKSNRAAELLIANRELSFQNKEKEKRAAELVIANEELVFQNEEKRKRAVEKEFDRNNLHALINNADDLMWSVDKDFNLITSNRPFDELVKILFNKKIANGTSVLLATASLEQLDQYKTFYKRALAGESFTEEVYNADVVEIWSEISYCPISTGDEVIGIACHSHDITERKINEESLLKSETKLKEAQAIARIGNFEIDMVQHYEVWSDQMYNILGIDHKTDHQLVPSTELLSVFIHPDDFDCVMNASKTLLDDSMDYRLVLEDGSLRYVYSEWRFEFDKDKNPTRLFGILQDITERKLGEIERKKIVTELTQRNKELEQFAYIVSHNLRAPVANIIGASTALNEKGLTAQEKAILNKGINTSVIKIDEVIHDLNQILQVKGNINEIKELVSFSGLVDDIKASISHLLDENDVEIKYDFPDINEYLSIKPYLYSIFLNLISNSVKYRQPGNHCVIEIMSHLLKDKVELTFNDNGMGIDLDKKGEQVFGLYKRFHTNIEGKGIGLFMVKTQVEALGGKISIKSRENVGTEFKIEFEI